MHSVHRLRIQQWLVSWLDSCTSSENWQVDSVSSPTSSPRATKQLALAHEKGPRFADPLKAWGDALVKQRRPKEALAKYDEALKYAPNWGALKAARAALRTAVDRT